jgi:AcrR family transcriptional regulator
MRMFASRGYTQVGIEDIGSAVGIAGPSVYNHWPAKLDLLTTDIDHLQEDERHSIRRAQHEHVSEWAHLLRLDQPLLDPVAARIRVHAVLSVAHDTARTARLHRNPAVAAAVVAICTRLLGLTASRPA